MDSEALVELFAPFGAVTTKRMFSGHGIYMDGVCFAIAIKPGLFLKADAEALGAFQAEGCQPFVYERKTGSRTVTSYWTMPDRAFDEPEVLVAFCALAEAAARRAAAKKRPKARKAKEKAGASSSGTAKPGRPAEPPGAELDAVFDAAFRPQQTGADRHPPRKPRRG